MTERIPIFPLGLVLLPGMEVPLHIFEERYRKMVAHCLEQDCQFGIVYYNGCHFRSTGCTCRIKQVTKEYSDGRKDIAIEGNHRFSLREIDDSGDYLVADVRYFSDCGNKAANAEAKRLQQEAVEIFVKLAEVNNRKFDVNFLKELTASEFGFLLSASDLCNLEERQENLESSSAANRIQNLVMSARRALMRAEAQNRLLDILGDNSDIRHIFN